MRRLQRWACLFACLVCAGCTADDPFAPSAIHRVYASNAGEAVAAVTQDGYLGVWSLEGGVSHGLRLRRGPSPPQTLALVNATGHTAVWRCGLSALCQTDLRTGVETPIVAGTEDGAPVLGAAGPGDRILLATQSGAVFEIGRSAREYKPRDQWSAGGPVPMYTLEASDDLEVVVSASTEIGMEGRPQVEKRITSRSSEGWFELLASEGRVLREPLWLGAVLWRAGRPTDIGSEIATRARAAVSGDGRSVAVKEEGGRGSVVYDGRTAERKVSLAGLNIAHCNGLQFLDPPGRFLGLVGYSSQALTIVDLANPSAAIVVSLRAGGAVAGGARVLAAVPRRSWLFVGLRDSSVDWYEYQLEPAPRIVHKATLEMGPI